MTAHWHEQRNTASVASSSFLWGRLLGKAWAETVAFSLINTILIPFSLSLSNVKSSGFLPKQCFNQSSAYFP